MGFKTDAPIFPYSHTLFGSRAQPGKLTEHTLYLMHIAPYPSRRRNSAHDRMLGRMEMFGRVLAGRGIATTDMAARLALPKRNPNSSLA